MRFRRKRVVGPLPSDGAERVRGVRESGEEGGATGLERGGHGLTGGSRQDRRRLHSREGEADLARAAGGGPVGARDQGERGQDHEGLGPVISHEVPPKQGGWLVAFAWGRTRAPSTTPRAFAELHFGGA